MATALGISSSAASQLLRGGGALVAQGEELAAMLRASSLAPPSLA